MRPKRVAVISHERSGTHFLMNTLNHNFQYVEKPWWNLDFICGCSFHDARQLKQHLETGIGPCGMPPEAILKSHHSVDFFEPIMEWFTKTFTVLYISRNADDVMRSFHRFCYDLPWLEGPKRSTAEGFAESVPHGACTRYQMIANTDMHERHMHHVLAWDDAAMDWPVHLFTYENLCGDFDAQVHRLADILEQPVPDEIRRPQKDTSIVVEAEQHTS